MTKPKANMQLYDIIKTEIDKQKAEKKAPQIVFLNQLGRLSGLNDKELRDGLNGLFLIGMIKRVETINLTGVILT